MYSLTVKPSFLLVPKSSSPAQSWVGSSSSSTVSFPVKTKTRGRRISLRLEAYDSSKNNDGLNASSGDSKPPNGTLVFFPLLIDIGDFMDDNDIAYYAFRQCVAEIYM